MAETATVDTVEAYAETEQEEVAVETAGTRSQMDKHQGFVDWYLEEYESDLNELSAAEVIAEFARLRNEFRRAEFYLERWGPEAREAARAQREAERERLADEREAARAQKAAERKAKQEAAEKAKAEAAQNGEGEDEKPKGARTRKRVAKKAAASSIVVDETGDDSGDEAGEDEIFD